ncbi:MAG TPA: resolvase [Rhodospirillaceae bacterium]|nr:resolvase [Rhodospirillaceae bacterium]
MKELVAPRLRCAIYTRKSSEEGLDMEFNSLDAQREACEAYILSQKAEGWTALPASYDDGGFSGGTLERPALKKLMEDIERGLVDSIVVYKIDRLSRSLMDFVKMVEVFDRHKVTFVSITQSFNTTTSMGRLILNILLSFAQFEREVIGERIRDKFAASRRKGMWMGGCPPLGYDVISRKLIVNPHEALLVREIFESFTQSESCVGIVRQLGAAGRTTKAWTTQDGRHHEGKHIDKQYIYRILHNRVYLGEAVHKGTSFPGEHKAIIDPPLWDETHRILARAPQTRGNISRTRQPSLLRGLVWCKCCGSAMTPSSTSIRARGASYRYYVCVKSLRNGHEACPIRSIPANELESAVLYQIKAAFKAPELVAMIAHCMGERDEGTAFVTKGERERLVRKELRSFEALWEELFVPEQRKLLMQLLERIEVSEEGVNLHLKKNCLTQWVTEAQQHGNGNDNHPPAA